jgi:hypothetical protein
VSANPIVLLAILGALISGAFAALQTPTNAMLSRAVNSPSTPLDQLRRRHRRLV